MRISWQPVLLGLLVGVVLGVCGALFSAGGHNFALMMIFFPWAMLLGSLFTQLPWLPFVVLVLLQFPIYFSLPRMRGKERTTFWTAVCVLTLIHLSGIVWCFVADRSESWRILFR
jgi:uncharacterized membrane protein